MSRITYRLKYRPTRDKALPNIKIPRDVEPITSYVMEDDNHTFLLFTVSLFVVFMALYVFLIS
jgi:hypothetical protein